MVTNNSVSGQQLDIAGNVVRGNEPSQWEGGHDPAKKTHFNIRLGFTMARGEHERYLKMFPKQSVLRMSLAQLGMAVIISGLQITTMCLMRRYTSLENLGAGIWSSAIVILGAKCGGWACEKPTYGRLWLTLAFQLMAGIGSKIMLILAITQSIPYQSRSLYQEEWDYGTHQYFTKSPTKEAVTALILTSVMTFLGMFQVVISVVVMGRAIMAISQRGLKIEFNVTGPGKGEKYGEEVALGGQTKNEEAMIKPPAYDDLSGQDNGKMKV